MATAGDGRPPYESDGAEEKFRKRLSRPELKNSTAASELSTEEGREFESNSLTVGKSELEEMLKQMTFTSAMYNYKDCLQVLEEENASPAEPAKAYKSQALRQDLKLLNNNATCISKASVIIVEYVDSLVWVTPAKHEMLEDA
ncbi:hypothetical protein L2E82_02719 [Cichorium intybus]|uniref:Uncharacterized protein n=1 Tax=Cichorium intybus TaxID=13427 RepID=A0ACB9H3A2_CICIN|nr:hypothetical protein L2E82_02719 [Cichorium intybus]